MASTTTHRVSRRPRPLLGGTLVLAACLFTATICLGIALVWLFDQSVQPGRWLFVVAAVALGALGVSAFVDTGRSVLTTRTTELGNTTRLISLAAVMITIPSLLISFAQDDGREASEARGLDEACPEGEVPDAGFTDVAPDATHGRAVHCLAWWGVVTGDGGTFAPRSTVTRAETATLLDRVASATGTALPPATPRFADVVDDPGVEAHAGAIGRVTEAGVMGGTGDDTFSPAGEVTRGQAATLLARAYRLVAGADLPAPADDGEPTFADVTASAHAGAVEAAAAAGLVSGHDGDFRPAEVVTRAQLATMLARTLDLLVADGAAEPPG